MGWKPTVLSAAWNGWMEKGENKLIVAVVSLLLEEQLLQLSQCQYKTCSGKKWGKNHSIKRASGKLLVGRKDKRLSAHADGLEDAWMPGEGLYPGAMGNAERDLVMTAGRHKHKETNTDRIGLSSAHKHLYLRMSEGGRKMRNSPKFPRRHSLSRVMVESNVEAEKGLGYRVIQKSGKGKEGKKEKGKGVSEKGHLCERWLQWQWQQKKCTSLSGLGDDGENSLAFCNRIRNGTVMQQTAREKGKNRVEKHSGWVCCHERL